MREKAGQGRVLLLSSDQMQTAVLTEILGKHVLAVATVWNIPEMLRLEDEHSHDVLFCDWRFEGGAWRDALQVLRSRGAELPFVVVCPAGGDYEWLEVLDAGGFDLIAAPWLEPSVVDVLVRALASRNARSAQTVA